MKTDFIQEETVKALVFLVDTDRITKVEIPGDRNKPAKMISDFELVSYNTKNINTSVKKSKMSVDVVTVSYSDGKSCYYYFGTKALDFIDFLVSNNVISEEFSEDINF